MLISALMARQNEVRAKTSSGRMASAPMSSFSSLDVLAKSTLLQTSRKATMAAQCAIVCSPPTIMNCSDQRRVEKEETEGTEGALKFAKRWPHEVPLKCTPFAIASVSRLEKWPRTVATLAFAFFGMLRSGFNRHQMYPCWRTFGSHGYQPHLDGFTFSPTIGGP